MFYLNNLFDEILLKPAREDRANGLEIVSGYATANMARRHMSALKESDLDCRIRLTLGMIDAGNGINMAQHKGFQLLQKKSNFCCGYWLDQPSPLRIHAKVYVWLKDQKPVRAFCGSANYSETGFGKSQAEIMADIDPVSAFDWCKSIANNATFCDAPDIENILTIIPEKPKTEEGVDDLESVGLSLLDTHTKEVHKRAGLNWGQRERRNPNEAYIPIPAKILQAGFFPEKSVSFTAITDDKQSFIFVVAQMEGKALETPEDNALIGKYFRKRLGLPDGARVSREDLERYGRTSVSFIKLDEETYYMDFSPPQK